MRSILVDSLFTTSAPSPRNARTDDDQTVHTIWEPGDEAGFTLVVGPDYSTGTDFSLIIEELSGNAGYSHAWNVKCLLKKEVEGQFSSCEESSVHWFTPIDSGDTVTRRVIQVTGQFNPGTVDNVSIQPGDYITFIVGLSAEPGIEDYLDVKVLNIRIEHETSQASLSDCPGRIGLIVETVRDLFNEPHADFLTDDFILRSINRCMQDVAMDGYWRRSTWVPVAAGQDAIDLLEAIPDFTDVYQVCYGPQRNPIGNLASRQRLMRLKKVFDTRGTPEFYIVENNRLEILPVPGVSLNQGILVYHSYCPAPLTCSDRNPNPDVPRSYDMLFVYFTLCQAFLKDRGAPGADVKFHEYNTLYQNLKNRLLATAAPGRASLSPSV